MSNFNYYLNRQGSRGRQGVKGDKGEAGYSPYIDIKSNTPTEFIMTIHNETESFDTPNLIPTAIGEKVTEMDAVLTTHTEDIANLKLEDQNINTNITSLQGDLTNLSGEVNTLSGEVASNSADITAIKNKNNAQDSDIAALKTRVGGTEESIEDLNHKYTVLGSEVSDLTLTKQNKLVEGANITLTDNADGTTTISASGSGGGGGSDVPIATTEIAGKVKPDGETITVTSDGTISSVSKDVTPIATTSTVGKVKPDGNTITITDDGTISAVGGGSGTGDVTAAGNNTFTGSNTFTSTTTFNAPIAVSGGGSTIGTSLNGDTSTYIDLKVNSQADLILGTGTVVTYDADGGTHIRDGQIKDTTGNILLSQENVTAGNNITITKTGKGIQIASSGGGGEAPANMVTTDTQQVITASKTISAHDGHSSSVKGGALTFENQDGASGYCAISIRKGSGDAIGYTPICQLSSDSFTIYQSEQAFNGYAQNSIQLTLQNAVPELVLRNPQGSSHILNDDKGLNIMNSAGNSGIFVPWNGASYKNQAGFLNIGSNSLRYYKDSTNYVDLLAGGSAPENMVTTDTNQDITGVKRFLNNRQDLSKPAIKIGNYAAGQDTYDGGYITSAGSNYLEIGSYYATNSKGGFLSINSTADSSVFKITSNNSNINPRLQLGLTNYEGEIYNDIAEGLCLSNRKYDYSGQRSILKIKDDTLTFKKTDGTVVDLLNNSSKEQYGIRADYALTHGVVDNPNGIISYNATDKNITVKQGLVLKTAGTNANKTTIASDMQHTVTSTGDFTLFYANGELLECGKVDYSTEEPTNNGVTNYQAWFNPDKTVNTNQQWQFKSNDTGNVWRYVDNSTPLADIVADSTAITSVSYIGYRVFDDDIFAHKSEWVNVNKQLLNNVDRTTENIVVDLRDSLPDDGATYDVLFSSSAQPTVEKNKFVAVLSSNGEISPAMRVCQSRVAVAGVDATAIGAFLLPITPSRSIMLGGSASANNGGTISLWMHAYKKIG